ncbi:MAG: Spy/CpxP family protein refolding chaperone [Deltaproteobacteria bacterium]|jgi:Spy/CpxP family protein refolding chaperone
MKKIAVLAMVLLMMGVAATSMADPRGMGHWGGPGGRMELGVLSSVNLTPEQTQKIRDLKEAHFRDTLPLQSEMFTKRAELRLLWFQTTLDADKIKATQAEIWNLWKQIQEKRTDFRLALRKILTPEQINGLLSQGLGDGMGKGFGRGPGGGYGHHGGGPDAGARGCWR